VDIQLRYLKDRLRERRIELDITADARSQLMEEGFDPAYGARPLKRVIQQRIENPLAGALIAGQFEDGDRIRVDATRHAFVFEKL
jgi:ATP-dependent Clp protease ATP-binding subunit ClpB